MRVIAGMVVGLVLVALLPVLQALLEAVGLSPPDNSFDHAFALVAIVLLCILIFKRTVQVRKREIRLVKPSKEEEGD